MTASVGREVKATFSIIFNRMSTFALTQSNDAACKQLAQFGMTFGGFHALWWQWIWNIHGDPPSTVIPSQVLSTTSNRLTDSTRC
ncbi:hypothetical protein [Aerobium aerolatum]|uniref:Uncharacterized protein n=1 Tax=Aquamicrobium aerolatum DSM 21857 TaxID=1121003 RepID=A0A1I3P8L0_9HYPH|nr:hypothetical protein [Aquamicrobium aerolatum]SFJ17904.1 hypothetical protein SAMN03080618_02247 [Aquamicrobium aerolatum DSM 21857]